MNKIVWVMGGFDPTGGAGVLADLEALSIFKVKAYSVITVNTAQNGLEKGSVEKISLEMISSQLQAIRTLGIPDIVKIGVLPDLETASLLFDFLEPFKPVILWDPVLTSSTGCDFLSVPDAKQILAKYAKRITIFTPNIPEAGFLLNCKIQNNDDMVMAGNAFCQMGIQKVIIKGGHANGENAEDVIVENDAHQWLSVKKVDAKLIHGTGCTFASALAGAIAKGFDVTDAAILAKMVVRQKTRTIPPIWPSYAEDLPTLSHTSFFEKHFLPCESPIGFYPIVDSLQWVEKLVAWGVKTIQLRIKTGEAKTVFEKIKRAIILCKQAGVQLFINDYWEWAIECGAYGVHLGQEDLDSCDLHAVYSAGLRLGVSTHSYTELARANAVNPSYFALGPIYPTTSKVMPFAPQGLENLKHWRTLVDRPLVAIGGISLLNINEILKCKVDGFSVISAVTQANDPQLVCQQFLYHYRESSSYEPL